MNDCTVEELGHTAEIGLRVRADSPATLFACVAQAMFGLLDVSVDEATLATERVVVVESMDTESLLVDWLSELLYLFETNGEVYIRCTVTAWAPFRLEARVGGRAPTRPPIMHIKAVTYHQLRVEEDENGWMAQVYFDI